MTFRLLLARLHAEYGSWKAIADKLDVAPQVLPIGRDRGTFSLEVLLRLAELAGESPSEVLTMTGKADVAELLERLYVTPQAPLSDEQRELLAHYGKLSKPVRRAIVVILRQLVM